MIDIKSFFKTIFNISGVASCAFIVLMLSAGAASALEIGFPDIASNIIDSADRLPGLVTAAIYSVGLLFGVQAVVKTKEAVENPSNVPIRVPAIRFAIGGSLFAFPTILSAVINTIDPNNTSFNPLIDDVAGNAGFLGIGMALGGMNTFNQIFANIAYTLSNTPLLVYGLSYLLALVIAATGLLKIKEHVEEGASKAELRVGIIRLLIAGALLTLPTIFDAVAVAISPGYQAFDVVGTLGGILFAGDISSLAGSVTGASGNNVNSVLDNILKSISGFPLFVYALAYFLGLVVAVQGLIKVKEHVEDPQKPLKEGVIRLLVAGALFALPMVIMSMNIAISGVLGALSFLSDATTTCPDRSGTLGQAVCNIMKNSNSLPFFFTTVSVLIGVGIGMWGVLRVQEHVVNPQQTPIWDPLSKIITAGGFLSVPFIVDVASNTLRGGSIPDHATTGFKNAGTPTSGLDGMLSRLMTDMYEPMVAILNWFGLVAGFVLIVIGISRMLKSSQDGAKGPAGIGTIMTFIAAGMLISFGPMVAAISATWFDATTTQTQAGLAYTAGMDVNAINNSNRVIAAIIQFLIILGLISIARGIFILRGVSEGNSQASMMAGLTHIFGGALAVNIIPVIQAVQTTLNITNYGLKIGDVSPYITTVTMFA